MQVTVRFYEELNHFLPVGSKKRPIACDVYAGETVKKVIEDLGVPHTEVDLVLVNGESVSFDYRLESEDRISVYPVFESFDIRTESKVRPEPLRVTRFILDVHLGKLAGLLRMLGFDTLYSNDYEDEQLVEIGIAENRIILTRDLELLKRKVVTHGYYVRSKVVRNQTAEVIRRFQLEGGIRPFTRCLNCNTALADVEKERIAGKVPPFVYKMHSIFRQCPECGKVYWKGTHWKRMKRSIEGLLSGTDRGRKGVKNDDDSFLSD
jgi:uncharacterized protein with PIN domain